jgi:YD repeat-containing protein
MASFAARLQGGAYLGAAPNGAYSFGTGDFTVEAWIRTTAAGTILSRKGTDPGQGNGGWLMVLQPDGGVKLATDSGFGYYQVISQARPIVDGEWHHVAGVRSGGTLAVYVDGVAVPVTASGNTPTPTNVTNGLRLLAGTADQEQEPYRPFTGDLAELRVWNVARSAAQIQAWMAQRLPLPQSGLVGYWTFDDRSLADLSATGNALAAQGQVDFTPLPPFTYAARLASSAYLAAASNGAYNFGTGDFTLEAWIRTTAAGTILSRKGVGGGQGNGGWLLVLQPTGAIKLSTDNGFGYYEAVSQARPILDGQWHHVAGVRSGGTFTIYVDGVAVPGTAGGSAVPPTNVSNSLRLLAGTTDQQQEPYRPFTGDLDELRVWNVARSATQIQTWMALRLSLPQSGLVGYWSFEQRSLADQSPTANGLAAQGTVAFTLPGAPLQPATYAVQLATSAFLAAAPNGAYNFATGGFTVEAWVRASGPGTILSRKGSGGGNGNGGWLLVLQPAGTVKLATDNGFGYYEVISQARPLLDGQWHHVAGVRSGGTFAIYVDGVAVPGTAGGSAVPPTNVSNSLRLLAGATDQPQEPYGLLPGSLGELRVWNVARSAEQIAAYWNQRLPLPQQGLVGYWSFSAATYADASPTGNAFMPQGSTALFTPGPPLASTPLAAPTIASVTYDGTNVSATWSTVTGAAGYTLTVYDGANPVGTPDNTTETNGSVAATLDPSKSYTVRVRATAGSNTGPESAAVPVIAAAPTIASVTYDGTNVGASWSPVTGAAGYTLTVYDGTDPVGTPDNTTETNGSVAATLDPTRSYTVSVVATNGVSTGPVSAAVPVIAAASVIASVTYDGANVGASWSPVTGATGYTLTVYDGTDPVGTPDTTTETNGSVAATLDPSRTYTVSVVGTNGVSRGAVSAAVPVIAAAPVIASVTYDGANVGASWSPVTGATGYTLTVYDGTDPVGTPDNTTETNGSVAATLDPSKSYTVRVRATAGSNTGPESAAVPVIAAAPTISSVTYDGTNVGASWSPVSGAAGYTLTVYDGTDPVGTPDTTTETSGSVAATLDPSRTYTVSVVATNGVSTGPVSAAVTVLTAAPTEMQLDYDGTALVASWQAVSGAPGYTAELSADGAPVETQPATDTTAPFTRAMASGVVYTARARVSAPPALGPWSGAATGPYLAAVTYAYDGLGRLTSVAMPAVTLGYTYDDAGNVLTATRTAPAGGTPSADPSSDVPTP